MPSLILGIKNAIGEALKKAKEPPKGENKNDKKKKKKKSDIDKMREAEGVISNTPAAGNVASGMRAILSRKKLNQ